MLFRTAARTGGLAPRSVRVFAFVLQDRSAGVVCRIVGITLRVMHFLTRSVGSTLPACFPPKVGSIFRAIEKSLNHTRGDVMPCFRILASLGVVMVFVVFASSARSQDTAEAARAFVREHA